MLYKLIITLTALLLMTPSLHAQNVDEDDDSCKIPKRIDGCFGKELGQFRI